MAKVDLSARQGFSLTVWGGYLLMLGADLPGHLSYDSVAQLHEGHFGLRETWGPAFYAWLLGVFDSIVPGTALYVAASGLLLFASLASLPTLRPRTTWLGPVAVVLAALTPQLLIYQGIVWKDVLFANFAVAGLVCLAHAARAWPVAGRRWLWLAAALVLLAAGGQARQNGLLAAASGAVALGWIASRGSWRRGAVWGVGGLVAVVAMTQLIGALALGALAKSPKLQVGSGVGFGMQIVERYDIVGAAAFDPTYRLDKVEQADPAVAEVIRTRARYGYSGQRVDLINRDPVLDAALGRVPPKALRAQWLDLALKHPALYLRVRWEDFRWVTAPPRIERCLSVHTGIDAPARLLDDLKIAPRSSGADVQLLNYTTWLLDTPVYWHGAYALVSLLLAGFLLWRREPADIAMAAMQLGGLAFAASFFLITIACDYRYLYFTDVAALVGLVYLAIDPAARRKPEARAR